MMRNAEFSEQPSLFEIYENNGTAQIELHDNIHEGMTAQGEPCWFADIYYMVVGKTENLAQRIEHNFAAYLTLAKQKEAEQRARDEIEATRLTTDEMTEMLADQEFRICLLELGVEDYDL